MIRKFVNFLCCIRPNAAKKIDKFSDHLTSGTLIYVAHIEGTPIEETVETAKKISDQGFIPMPHFPARIIKNKEVLGDWIARYQNEAGVENALLIAGLQLKVRFQHLLHFDILQSSLQALLYF